MDVIAYSTIPLAGLSLGSHEPAAVAVAAQVDDEACDRLARFCQRTANADRLLTATRPSAARSLQIVRPPSTGMQTPVMNSASSETR